MIKQRLIKQYKGVATLIRQPVEDIMLQCKLQKPNFKPLQQFISEHQNTSRTAQHDRAYAFLLEITKLKNYGDDEELLQHVFTLMENLNNPGLQHPTNEKHSDSMFGRDSPFRGEQNSTIYHENCCYHITRKLTYQACQGRKRCSKAKGPMDDTWPNESSSEVSCSELNENYSFDDSEDVCDYCGSARATTVYCGASICEDCYESQAFSFD